MPDEETSPSVKRLALFGLAVAAVVVVILLMRSGGDDKKPDPKGSGATTSESSSGGSAAPTGLPNPPSSVAAPNGSPGTVTSGKVVDMSQVLMEAKYVEAARAALAADDPKKALKEIEAYEKIPNVQSLSQEATLVKIEALSKVGRKSDALALAYLTRDDPAYEGYRGRIEALINDAGS